MITAVNNRFTYNVFCIIVSNLANNVDKNGPENVRKDNTINVMKTRKSI